MRTIKEMMDSLTDRDKYLWSLIEKLPMLPVEGMNQDEQHFWAVQVAVYDITKIDATEDFIHEIETGAFKNLDDLQYYLTYEVEYEEDDEVPCQAAHIVASVGSKGRWSKAAKSREILKYFGIDINHAANGIVFDESLHGITHTAKFIYRVYDCLNEILDKCKGLNSPDWFEEVQDELLNELRRIGYNAVNGNFNF